MRISKEIEYIKPYEVEKHISPDTVKNYSFLNVKYKDEKSETSYRAFYFVEEALKEYQHFNDDYKLLKAVEFCVKELFSEDYRKDFSDYILSIVAKGEVGKSNDSGPNKLVARNYIWKRAHYYNGQGIGFHATNGAIIRAGEEYDSLSLSSAKARFKEAKRCFEQAETEKSGPNYWRYSKDISFREGRIDKVKEIVDTAIRTKKGKEQGIYLACKELKIEKSECLSLYKAMVN